MGENAEISGNAGLLPLQELRAGDAIGKNARSVLTKTLIVYYGVGWAINLAATAAVLFLQWRGAPIMTSDLFALFLVALIAFDYGFFWFRHRIAVAYQALSKQEPWFAGLTLVASLVLAASIRHPWALAYGVIAAATLARMNASVAVTALVASMAGHALIVWFLWPPIEGKVFLIISASLVQILALSFAANLFREWRSVERLSRVNRDLASTRELLRAVGAMAEKAKIARDIHDVSGHKLTTAKLQLDLLEDGLEDSDQRERVLLLRRLVQDLMQDLRKVVIDGAAGDQIEFHCSLNALVRALPNGMCVVDVGDQVSLSPPQAEGFLRIAQESLTNALRHSGADAIKITCRSSEQQHTLMIVDNGRGFDARSAPQKYGGLNGMAARLESLGGCLSVSSMPGEGTEVRAELPRVVYGEHHEDAS